MTAIRNPIAGVLGSRLLRSRHLGSRLLAAESGREGDRVTTLELFFDLVYAFAFTQVASLMAHGTAISALQGLVVLSLLWWSWTSYAWLANQAHADRGIVRVGVMSAIAIMFLVSLTIPEAYHDRAGGLFAPMVFVVGYIAVRVVHAVVYIVAAGTDAALRRQIIVSMTSALLPAAALLVIGALVGAPYQVWIWLVAIALDLIVVYLTSSGGSWRLPSVAHFAERHGLIVMLALGESVVAIGAGSARLALSVPIVVGAVLGVALAIGLWWTYFNHLSAKAEREVGRQQGVKRVGMATDAYTYLHFALVAGIILTALGIERAMEQVASSEPLGLFAAGALGGGVAVYLAGTGFFWRRVSGEWALVRFSGAALAVVAIPLLRVVPALVGVGVVVVILIVLIVVEQLLGQRAKIRSRAAA